MLESKSRAFDDESVMDVARVLEFRHAIGQRQHDVIFARAEKREIGRSEDEL